MAPEGQGLTQLRPPCEVGKLRNLSEGLCLHMYVYNGPGIVSTS